MHWGDMAGKEPARVLYPWPADAADAMADATAGAERLRTRPVEEVVLLEVPDDHVLRAVESGDGTVTFKGDPSDEAVLCTAERTYVVRVADSSDTLLLLAPAADGTTDQLVQAELHGYFELRCCPPRMARLRQLLAERPYRGDAADAESSAADRSGLYTLDDLRTRVQASDEQLRTALVELHAVEVDGFWRVLDTRTAEKTLKQLLILAAADGWNLQRLSLRRCIAALEPYGVSPVTVRSCLNAYGSVASCDADGTRPWRRNRRAQPTDDGARLADVEYGLSEAALCRFRALELLRSGRRWPLADFLLEWGAHLPDGMVARTEHLLGHAVIDGPPERQIIHYFPASDLPEDPSVRLARLFHEMPTWPLEQIEPYLVCVIAGARASSPGATPSSRSVASGRAHSDVVPPTLSVSAWLLKHARAWTDKAGRTMYSARY